MEKSILNPTNQSKTKTPKRGSNKDLFKDQKTNKSSLLNRDKTKKASTIKIKEIKQEEDYSKKIEKLKTILEKKNKTRINRKKILLSDSKCKLIIALFGIAIVNKYLLF